MYTIGSKLFHIEKMGKEHLHLLPQINTLIRELSPLASPLDTHGLQALLSASESETLLAFVGDELAGMLTLCSAVSPTGKKYWVEDVVVRSSFRGRGLGRSLMEEALRRVGDKENSRPVKVMLTSRPQRVAANALYRALGFRQKETHVYVMPLGQEREA